MPDLDRDGSVRGGAQVVGPSHPLALLERVGFLLVPGPPADRGPAYLLVALRPRPTRRHFDPERIDLWLHGPSGAASDRLTWPVPRADRQYAWGTIRVVDRLRATNLFTSFGGRLTITRTTTHHAALFASDAPILDLGEHAGRADPFAVLVDVFFARLRAAGGDAAFSAARPPIIAPVVLYAAFLHSALSLSSRGEVTPSIEIEMRLRAEKRRLELESGDALAAGRRLAQRLAERSSPALWRQAEMASGGAA